MRQSARILRVDLVATATVILWSLLTPMGGPSLFPILLPASRQRQAILPNWERLARRHQYPLSLIVSLPAKKEPTPRTENHRRQNTTGRQAKGQSSCHRGPSGPSLSEKSRQCLRTSHRSIIRTMRQQEKLARLLRLHCRKQSPKAVPKASMRLSMSSSDEGSLHFCCGSPTAYTRRPNLRVSTRKT